MSTRPPGAGPRRRGRGDLSPDGATVLYTLVAVLLVVTVALFLGNRLTPPPEWAMRPLPFVLAMILLGAILVRQARHA